MLRGPIIQYDSYLEKYDIEFNDTNFKNYITTFRSSDTRILSIVSENIIISSIKLYKELIQTTKLKDFIYVRLSSINDSIIHAFESNLTDRLIVIELDLDEVKFDHWIEKINKIFDPIQSSNKNKLIIISNQKNALKNILLADKKFDEINDDANTLQNFTIDSQKCILDTGTKFQRSHAKLSDLIDNDDLKNLINGETLLKILKDENIELYGKFIKNKYENYWTRKNRENLDIVASKNLAEDMYSKFVNQSKFLALDFLFDKNINC